MLSQGLYCSVPDITYIAILSPADVCDSAKPVICAEDGLCISLQEVCDGVMNCPRGSDEVNCSAETRLDGDGESRIERPGGQSHPHHHCLIFISLYKISSLIHSHLLCKWPPES